uniref:Uncharacterized protein n=1 Tax=Sipha flava TaxID=143950 RepID=A0A2S2Q0V4_9HEMI
MSSKYRIVVRKGNVIICQIIWDCQNATEFFYFIGTTVYSSMPVNICFEHDCSIYVNVETVGSQVFTSTLAFFFVVHEKISILEFAVRWTRVLTINDAIRR